MDAPTQHDIAIGNDGERMIVVNLWGYYAHLSIYHFALPHCFGRRVLDAGSGTGYGAAYLARNDASVWAVDAGADAIAYAQRRYVNEQVVYAVADLNQPLAYSDRSFDVVFSSNVFEHVADVDGLTAECARVVKPDGVVIIAVPPITSAGAALEDMRNQFHVHHIPPAAWLAKFKRFFEVVECRGHIGAGKWREEQQAEAARPGDQVTIRETDFEFPVCDPEEMEAMGSITAVFVCRRPRFAAGPETLAERTPLAWHESALAAKVITDERAALAAVKAEAEKECAAAKAEVENEQAAVRADVERIKADIQRDADQRDAAAARGAAALRDEIEHLHWQIAALERSTSWRITAPLRRVVSAVRKRG